MVSFLTVYCNCFDSNPGQFLKCDKNLKLSSEKLDIFWKDYLKNVPNAKHDKKKYFVKMRFRLNSLYFESWNSMVSEKYNCVTKVTSLFSEKFENRSLATFAMISYHLTTCLYTTALSVRSFWPLFWDLAFRYYDLYVGVMWGIQWLTFVWNVQFSK